MAEQDIIQNLITQLGQSQKERQAKELGIHFADVDEQTTADLLRFAKAFSEFVNYYQNNSITPVGNWSNFFPDEAAIESLLKSESANTSPHLALLLAFLELYKQPQSVINNITARHLDFYYQDVLRLKNKAAIADKVHLLLELKKNVAPVRILPEHLFSAGKDATNVELIYNPTRETIINAAKVESLRSIFFAQEGGGKLAVNEPKWSGFGSENLPPAEVGFAIASPVLRMKEGTRKVTVSLQLNKNIDSTQLNNTSLNNAFDVFITGEKSWLGPYTVSPSLNTEKVLTFSFTVPETEKAVIDYNAAIHGYSYGVQTPIVQVLLRDNNANIGYNNFNNVRLETATVSVEVSNITSLILESDGGSLDAKKAFLPFGPQPTKGSRFLVGYPEALSKKLSNITLTVQWKNAPQKFSDYYKKYKVKPNNIPDEESPVKDNNHFTAAVAFQDGGSSLNTSYRTQLFDSSDATLPYDFEFPPKPEKVIKPVTGFITFLLEQDFLHATYRIVYVQNVMEYSKTPPNGNPDKLNLNEPYTPTIQSISLYYKASSEQVNIAYIESTGLDDFANPDLQFFHITYFGQMREHGYQRQQIESKIKAGIDTAVPLLPSYNHAGELLIGLSQLNAGDSVSVLFQVAEGSANPDLPSEDLHWFVLCDNYWKPLSRSEVVLDTTNQLLTSGIIQFIIPLEATTHNTILPSGLIWIKAAININPAIKDKDNVTAVCQLIDVAANAVEVQFVDRGNDPNHLLTALEPGRIAKLRNGISAIKTVKQPYSSFGGRAVETDSAFYTRVSERLRHKNRCLTPWDYERIILEAFPKVHKVKCIPHANEKSWLAPGNVLIVVVSDLKNKNAMNPLEPKVDADTIKRITSHVKERTGMRVSVKVKNPSYQKIKTDFKVKFFPEYEFNFHQKQLEQDIIGFLSPWLYDSEPNLSFGGKIYKSVLLDFVEELPYVDYVTDFKMYSSSGEVIIYNDINEVQPGTPDTILVSDTTHIINPAT